jgi:hypothetical protein
VLALVIALIRNILLVQRKVVLWVETVTKVKQSKDRGYS